MKRFIALLLVLVCIASFTSSFASSFKLEPLLPLTDVDLNVFNNDSYHCYFNDLLYSGVITLKDKNMQFYFTNNKNNDVIFSLHFYIDFYTEHNFVLFNPVLKFGFNRNNNSNDASFDDYIYLCIDDKYRYRIPFTVSTSSINIPITAQLYSIMKELANASSIKYSFKSTGSYVIAENEDIDELNKVLSSIISDIESSGLVNVLVDSDDILVYTHFD